jgi:ribosome recycling factor
VVRVPIPPLTEERRREYVKMVRSKAEDARVAVRNVRREEVHRVQQQEKGGEIPEDQAKRALEQLQKITDQHTGLIDAMAARKEAEVMEV